ncbi:aldehyde dehydrogenase family protein [Ancylobacter sp. MQZ15Z-1]|uniref:Aldehyde dehydrogenase family protein n=1 Tax=Ancylobacter mangrovi TaxID=2972472 RepID=A0A9X2PD20_9HYPH|nr:aldehyde dehydrogenase family protein [Ancylobacter mangrovi]MCS0496497.1 aldehyde dehydrogenase family protein [Ancylobacter mangrovi]
MLHQANRPARTMKVVNPAAPSTVVAEVAMTEPSDLPAIVDRARAGFEVWRKVPMAERVQRLETFFAAIAEAAGEIAAAITREQGKPIREARAETLKAVSEARAMAAHGMSVGTQGVASARPGVRNMVVRRPRGVIGAITPWNFPILTPMRKIAPALVFGNAIILKPSEFTPSAALIVEALAARHLPAGLVQVVVGEGPLGAALCRSGLEGITFTGSIGVGRKVAEAAADQLAEVSLELGGKNAAVVNDVADMDNAVGAIVGAAMQCAGQRCTAVSRVIVADEIADELVEALRRRCAAFRIGDGMAEDTDIGAITTDGQLAKVAEMVEEGRAAGATLVLGGARCEVADRPDGRFYAPTIFDHVTPEMRIAREEIFGPVISVMRYASFDEALAIVNGTPYGLTSALFSNRNDLINRFIDEVKSGMIHINHGTVPDSHMPFGGIGESGLGSYSVGASAAAFYTTEHAIYNQYA